VRYRLKIFISVRCSSSTVYFLNNFNALILKYAIFKPVRGSASTEFTVISTKRATGEECLFSAIFLLYRKVVPQDKEFIV
jgi:hypothetical protein